MYLTKPVTSSSLFDAINKVVASQVESRPPVVAPEDGVGKMLRILVTDDDSNNRVLVTNILGQVAYQVVIARDGLEATDLFSRAQPISF